MKRRNDGVERYLSPCGKKIGLIDVETGMVWIMKEVPSLKAEAAKRVVRQWSILWGSAKKRKAPANPSRAAKASDKDRAYLRSLVPGPVFRVAYGPKGRTNNGKHVVAMLAERNVDGTPVRRGDVVIRLLGSEHELPPIRGQAIRLPRASFALVADNLDAFRVLELARYGDGTMYEMRHVEKTLRRRQQARYRDNTSPFVIVRSLVGPVSEPIIATSDDAALFELLAQVGGRMPTEGGRAS